jgi:hypothetical protein
MQDILPGDRKSPQVGCPCYGGKLTSELAVAGNTALTTGGLDYQVSSLAGWAGWGRGSRSRLRRPITNATTARMMAARMASLALYCFKTSHSV